MGTAEVARDALVDGSATVVSHDHHAVLGDRPESAKNGRVVAIHTVAVQFTEILNGVANVIGDQRTTRMAGDENRLPRLQPGVDLLGGHEPLPAKLCQRSGTFTRRQVGLGFHRADLGLE
jgi:hypothetical protein